MYRLLEVRNPVDTKYSLHDEPRVDFFPSTSNPRRDLLCNPQSFSTLITCHVTVQILHTLKPIMVVLIDLSRHPPKPIRIRVASKCVHRR